MNERNVETQTIEVNNTNVKTTVLHSFFLLISTLVWGVAFVAQTTGGSLVGAFSFTAIRFLIAAVLLFVLCFIRRKKVKRDIKVLFKGGVICGVLLALATNLQQFGLNLGTSAGKAGFLTAVYIILVPIVGFIIYKKKSGWNVWVGVVIALVSLYLLCMKDSFTFELSDLLVLACALVFSFQILSIDRYAPLTDPFELSCVQFLTCGAVSLIPALIFELGKDPVAWTSALTTTEAWIPLLYAAIMSSGVGYTFQVLGQKGINPTLAALLMSFESVFAALSGWIILHQVLTAKELIGCALMFVAIIIAQIPFPELRKKKKEEGTGE